MPFDVVVVGAGAAGLTAGACAARRGLSVLICERNDKAAKKVGITGKGRCNVTNDCEVAAFLQNLPRGSRFMYSSASSFGPRDTIELFESLGVPLKTERGARVFPQSDKASDIVDALVRRAADCGCALRYGARIGGLVVENGEIAGVTLVSGEKIAASAVIIATGGLSYPGTGSTGDGYRLAAQAGQGIVQTTASLVPLITKEAWVPELQGLSLRNVTLTLINEKTKREVFSELGEMLFTHFGVSGPLVLSASAHMGELSDGYKIAVDLKPGLTYDMLDKRLQRDFLKYANRDFANSLGELLPQKLIPVVVSLSGIPADLKVNSVTKEMRISLCRLLKALAMTVKDRRPVAEAVITRGGINVSEVNPKTMESKTTKGLYFAGEVLDVDGYTGGFNLQVAFTTGFAAGNAVLEGKNA